MLIVHVCFSLTVFKSWVDQAASFLLFVSSCFSSPSCTKENSCGKSIRKAENNIVKVNFSFLYFSDHQAKAVLKFIEAISEKTLRSTVALTAARGRGKSAALGLAIAGAVAFG